MAVVSTVVHPSRIAGLWDVIPDWLEVYRKANPHYTPTAEELRQLLEEGENELFVFGTAAGIAGFMTFKVQRLEPNELWGTIAIIYIDPPHQHTNVLQEAAAQLEQVLRDRGCNIMNYMTAREGFKRLAPKLGFRPRIIEWMKEL